MHKSLQTILIFSIPAALCIITFLDSLNGNYVFDDTVAIVKNKDVVNAKTTLAEIFRHDFWGANLTDPTSHKSYRPLTILMFHLEYNSLQLRSFGMKCINLLVHCINSCLVYKLFEMVLGERKSSAIGAVIFAVHPVHAEAVCGVVGRADLMFCLCLLVAVVVFIDIDRDRQFESVYKCLAVVIISSIGLVFKETAIVILPLCVFLDLVLNKDWNTLRNEGLSLMKQPQAILIYITAVQLTLRLYMQNFEGPQFKPMDNPIASNDSMFTRVLSQSFLYVLNCWIMILPQWLCFDWALGCVKLVSSVWDLRLLAILTFYLTIFKLIARKDYVIISALGLLIIPFLPASGILKVGFVIGERVLYAPSIGFCLIIAYGYSILNKRFKITSTAFLTILVIVLVARSYQRSIDWATENRLFTSGLLVCPDNAKIHYNIARLSTDRGETTKAFEYYHNAIRLFPDYEAALMNLGNLYREIGDFKEANNYIRKSIAVLEEFPAAWMNLGIVQASQKQYSEAMDSYNKALKYRKRYPACHYNLGNLFLDMKDFSQAMKHWTESIALNPNQPKAWANILILLDNRSLWLDAIRMSDRALQHLPNNNQILFIRANVHGKLKQYIEAERIYLKVLAADPRHALGHTNLGVLYHRWGKMEAAIESYRNALQINPNLKTAKDNLRKLLNKS